MNDCYYELETIINELPQQTIAKNIQRLFYDILNQEKQNSPILEVEKYFRKMIKKIEQFYCRRLQKLEYFIKKKADIGIVLQRISKYIEKKPWRLENMDYTQQTKQQKKTDNKNCNQLINFDLHSNDYHSSKTSTPFSHYSCIPSIPRDTSLNEVAFLDQDYSVKSSFYLDKDENSIDISQIQLKLQLFVDKSPKKKNKVTPKKDPLADLIDGDLEDFSALSPHHQNMLDFNISGIKSGFDSKLISSRSLQKDSIRQLNNPNSPKQLPQTREFESLFQTQQSTKEILKYVEQFHQQQNFKIKPSSVDDNQNQTSYFQDKTQSPSTCKRYRVRSSYQREIPSQMKLKANTSHENFEIRTSKSNQTKKKHFQLPSPLNESMNQQKQKMNQHIQQQQQQQQQQQLKKQQRQPHNLPPALSQLYKKFSLQKQSQSVVTKRSIKQPISYSLEKEYYKKGYKQLLL